MMSEKYKSEKQFQLLKQLVTTLVQETLEHDFSSQEIEEMVLLNGGTRQNFLDECYDATVNGLDEFTHRLHWELKQANSPIHNVYNDNNEDIVDADYVDVDDIRKPVTQFIAVKRKNKANHYHKAYTLIDDTGKHCAIVSSDLVHAMSAKGQISEIR